MPDGIDQSWGYTDPAAAKAAGVRVVSMYLSHDPSKNATAAKIKAYHAAGIGVLLNWESDAGRPLLGAGAGAEDGHDAVAQVDQLIAEVGYQPGSKLAIPFSCDTDANPSQYPQIDAYYSATRSALGDRYVNGVYGEADLVAHLHAAGLTQMEWQTLAWSGGRIDPEADFYQESINDSIGGTSVDFDRIIHIQQLGAWWPPGHLLNDNTAQPIGGKEMDRLNLIQVGRKVYKTDRIWIEYIPDPATLRRVQADFKAHGGDPRVYVLPSLVGFGKLVPA